MKPDRLPLSIKALHLEKSRTVKLVIPCIILLLLAGCSMQSSPIIFPKGSVTEEERNLLFIACLIMSTVLAPVYLLTAWVIFRYRKGGKGTYRPKWSESYAAEAFNWFGPIVIVAVLSYLLTVYTYKLDPYKPIATDQPPINVQVVAQDWKWLFIYPELGIASVNELAFPQHRPLRLEITSDTVMTSFMIPALGGQIYAMAGMKTYLNLLSNEIGRFEGKNTQFSGTGFYKNTFHADAMTKDRFASWVKKAKQSPEQLSYPAYDQLRKPSIDHSVEYFSNVSKHLFDDIVSRYRHSVLPTLSNVQRAEVQ